MKYTVTDKPMARDAKALAMDAEAAAKAQEEERARAMMTIRDDIQTILDMVVLLREQGNTAGKDKLDVGEIEDKLHAVMLRMRP